MINQMDDQAIIDKLFERNEDALRMLSSKYDNYLQKIAWNILADNEDCEECRNDTYLKVWNSIPPNRPENMKAYLATIIRNLAIDRYKKKNRSKRIRSEYTVSLDELEECVPDQMRMEEAFQSIQLQKVMDDYVRSLSERQQYIFVCRYYCQDKVSDIAVSLKISRSMVFNELKQIRERLRKRLEEERYLL